MFLFINKKGWLERFHRRLDAHDEKYSAFDVDSKIQEPQTGFDFGHVQTIHSVSSG